MLDVCLLGTGGMMPLPYRWLTSLMMRYNGKSILIDCGEGTQLAMRHKGWSPNPIDIICFTHFHADHQRSAGDASDHGKCGADRTVIIDRTERSYQSSGFFTCDRTGVAF